MTFFSLYYKCGEAENPYAGTMAGQRHDLELRRGNRKNAKGTQDDVYGLTYFS
jgi:hypothetical protein